MVESIPLRLSGALTLESPQSRQAMSSAKLQFARRTFTDVRNVRIARLSQYLRKTVNRHSRSRNTVSPRRPERKMQVVIDY